MKTVFDYVDDVKSLRIAPHDVLLKAHQLEDSKIILSEKQEVSEEGRAYAEVISVGKEVDQAFVKEGDIILILGGNRMMGFKMNGEQYMISPVHNVLTAVSLPHFKVTKNVSASVSKAGKK